MSINELFKQSERIQSIFKVTSDIYYSFQRCSNDFNPLHTDEEFAVHHGFESKVMYGNILNCFISQFVGMLLPTRKVVLLSQDIQYHKPVYLNDEIILDAEAETLSNAANMIVYKLRFSKQSAGQKKMIAKGHVQIGILKEKGK